MKATKPRKRIAPAAAALALALGCALPLQAGIQYKARTYQEGEQKNDMVSSLVEVWVDGESARIEFLQSANPMMPQGRWLVTTDAGRTMYLVNPEDRTYSKWDLKAMLESVSGVMQSLGPMMNFEIQEPRVETLADEPGGEMMGYATRHYKYRTTYRFQMKIMGMKSAQDMEQVQEMWATDQLDAAALGLWMMREPPDFGDSGLKELIEAEMSKVKGFPLKTVLESVSTNKKGKQSTTRTITQVEALEERAIGAERFRIDPSFRETEPPLPMGEEDNGLKGLFGRKRGGG